MAKQTRINNAIRAHIVEKAMADAFDQRMKNLKICMTAFADDLYERNVSHLALIAKKLPSGWVSYNNCITISFKGFVGQYEQRNLGYEGMYPKPVTPLVMSEYRPVPLNALEPIVIKEDDLVLANVAQRLVDMHTRLFEERKSFHDAVFTLTHQYATVEKLLEGWPDGVKYVPQTTAATISNIAPVGLLDEVRRILAQGKVE